MKKIIALVLAALSCALLLTGCGGSLKPLDAAVFDEEAVIATAKSAAEHMTNKEFEELNAMIREDLRETLSVQAISDAYDQLVAGAGDFDSFGEATTAQTADKKTDSVYAAVQLVAVHAEKKLKYTVYMDTDLMITGFYIG